MIRNILAVSLLTAALAAPAAAGDTPSAPGAKVYFINLADGQTVSSPMTIQFGLSGMGVAPAGIDKAKTGHHHLLIDTGFDEVNADEPLPAYEQLLHFGGGQTETMLELTPGTHTLQLVLGDLNHIPHDPPVISDRITVTVK